jgi:hypothetical protein
MMPSDKRRAFFPAVFDSVGLVAGCVKCSITNTVHWQQQQSRLGSGERAKVTCKVLTVNPKPTEKELISHLSSVQYPTYFSAQLRSDSYAGLMQPHRALRLDW